MKNSRFPARMEDLPRMMGWILDIVRENDFPGERVQDVELASEEALVNIIRHGFPDGKQGYLEIRCCPKGADRLEIEFVDDGVPFDPTTRAQPPLDLPVEQRQVGGLGIFLIRQLIEEVRYRREGGRNVFTWVVHRQRGG